MLCVTTLKDITWETFHFELVDTLSFHLVGHDLIWFLTQLYLHAWYKDNHGDTKFNIEANNNSDSQFVSERLHTDK